MNYFNYFTEIEETFIRRRGKHLLLSPLDWALIESWEERRIPLRIILRGIENVFDSIDKNPTRKRTVKSLTYCREEIEAQYNEWLGTQVGKNGVETAENEITKNNTEEIESSEPRNESTLFSDETIATHLENVSRKIHLAKAKADGALRHILDKVAKELSEHQKTQRDAESLEESLIDLEGLIDKTLLDSIDKSSLDKMKNEVEKELSQHSLTMEEAVYERTFDLMLLKRLREQAEIPRLSLFYL